MLHIHFYLEKSRVAVAGLSHNVIEFNLTDKVLKFSWLELEAAAGYRGRATRLNFILADNNPPELEFLTSHLHNYTLAILCIRIVLPPSTPSQGYKMGFSHVYLCQLERST